MARHYGTAILPARPYKPKDKAKAEAGVLLVERWILAHLRHQTFFSLHELNLAIAALLQELNGRSFQKLPGRAARKVSKRSTDRPSSRYRKSLMTTPIGSEPKSLSTITSRPTSITTASRIDWSVSTWTSASVPLWSKPFTKASGCRRIPGRPGAATLRCRNICPNPTKSTISGRQDAF
jgi:hypothetical protein